MIDMASFKNGVYYLAVKTNKERTIYRKIILSK
jgi:hypothetical protein